MIFYKIRGMQISSCTQLLTEDSKTLQVISWLKSYASAKIAYKQTLLLMLIRWRRCWVVFMTHPGLCIWQVFKWWSTSGPRLSSQKDILKMRERTSSWERVLLTIRLRQCFIWIMKKMTAGVKVKVKTMMSPALHLSGWIWWACHK